MHPIEDVLLLFLLTPSEPGPPPPSNDLYALEGGAGLYLQEDGTDFYKLE